MSSYLICLLFFINTVLQICNAEDGKAATSSPVDDKYCGWWWCVGGAAGILSLQTDGSQSQSYSQDQQWIS